MELFLKMLKFHGSDWQTKKTYQDLETGYFGEKQGELEGLKLFCWKLVFGIHPVDFPIGPVKHKNKNKSFYFKLVSLQKKKKLYSIPGGKKKTISIILALLSLRWRSDCVSLLQSCHLLVGLIPPPPRGKSSPQTPLHFTTCGSQQVHPTSTASHHHLLSSHVGGLQLLL